MVDAVADVFDLDRLAAALADRVRQGVAPVDGSAVDADQQIALLQTGRIGRIAGADRAHLNFVLPFPAGGSHAFLVVQHRRQSDRKAAACALDRNRHRSLGALNFLRDDFFPIRIVFAVQPNDLVAHLNACLRGRGIRDNVADHRTARVQHLLVTGNHVEPGEDPHRQHDVHERARGENDQPLPARLVEHRAGIVPQVLLRCKPTIHMAASSPTRASGLPTKFSPGCSPAILT